MKFLNPLNLLSNKELKDENYLAITLTNTEVMALTWCFEGDDVKVLGFSKKPIPTISSLPHQAAQAIDSAAQKTTAEISKAVYGLSHYYLEGNQPTKETSRMLKSLSDDLELEPQAFVSQAAAINHLLKVENSPATSSILIGIYDNFCEIHLIENNVLTKTQIAKSQIDESRLVNLVRELKAENRELPAKIIFFGNINLPIFKNISNISWKGLFLHEPKTLVLEDVDLARSVAYAHAADILGYEPKVESQAVFPSEAIEESASENTNDFGFIEGEDVLEAENKNLTSEETDLANFSPVSKEEEEQLLTPVATHTPVVRDPNDYAVIPPFAASNVDYNEKPITSTKFKSNPLFKLKKIVSQIKLSPKKIGISLIVLIILSVSFTFVLARTIASVEIILNINAKQLEKDFAVNVKENASFSVEESKIEAIKVSSSAQGNLKAVATGTKRTGTKAKGEVKILNWDKNSSKTFKAGQEVTTKDGLRFSLDGEIEVASRGATTPGEAKTAATSIDFGTKYNISQGVDLTLVGFDEVFYSALSETAFSGGEERQITVVSKEDLTKLEKDLTKNLTEKAKTDLKNQGHQIDDSQITIKVQKREFDRKEGEEATIVNLNLEIEAQALVYSENDLKKLLSAIASKDADLNYEALEDQISITNLSAKKNGSSLNLSGKFRASLTPKINEDEIKNRIKGKSTKEARALLLSLQDVSEVKFNFRPNIQIMDSLPTNLEKIKFKIEVN